MAERKKGGNCWRLIVTGCLAERYREELRTEIPEIDAVLGTGEVPDIVRAIGGGAATRAARSAPDSAPESAQQEHAASGAFGPSTRQPPPHEAQHPPRGTPAEGTVAYPPELYA